MKDPANRPPARNEPPTTCSIGDTATFIAAFREKVRQQRIPLSGTFTLTRRCNFRCPHCYLGPADARAAGLREISLEETMTILDQAAEAGCLTMLLTGGEPLCRPEFNDIYRYAAGKGLLLTLFSNGSLFSKETVDVLRTYPPRAVEITLYGASEETYRRVTGCAGMYRRVMEGIRTLREAGLRLRLKTMLMTTTEKDLPEMESLARDLGVDFRFDAALSPTLEGGRSPVAFRVPPLRVAQREADSAAQIGRWTRTMENLPASADGEDRLYTCGAGRTGFHVDARGQLSPCLMMPWMSYDLATMTFEAAWQALGDALSKLRAPADFPCRACRYKNVCGYCPAFFRLETGSEMSKADYLCELGRCRLDKTGGVNEY